MIGWGDVPEVLTVLNIVSDVSLLAYQSTSSFFFNRGFGYRRLGRRGGGTNTVLDFLSNVSVPAHRNIGVSILSRRRLPSVRVTRRKCRQRTANPCVNPNVCLPNQAYESMTLQWGSFLMNEEKPRFLTKHHDSWHFEVLKCHVFNNKSHFSFAIELDINLLWMFSNTF